MASIRETVRYWGETESDREAALCEDATARAAAGWRAISQVTDWPVGKPGLDLVVTYELIEPGVSRPLVVDSSPKPSALLAAIRSTSPLTTIRHKLPYLGLVAFVFALVNFAWFMVESIVVGDALNGYQSGGHFFVLHKPGYTEVSQALWEWLRFHGTSVFVAGPVGMAGGAWFGFRVDWPKTIAGKKTAQETTARIGIVRSTGPALATAKSGGSIGRLHLSGPLIKVSVYPGGIVVKPLFMAEHAVLASEIDHVTATRAWTRREVTIEHAGVDMKSPLLLYAKGDSEIFAAIRSVGDPVSYRAEQHAADTASDLADLKWRDE